MTSIPWCREQPVMPNLPRLQILPEPHLFCRLQHFSVQGCTSLSLGTCQKESESPEESAARVVGNMRDRGFFDA